MRALLALLLALFVGAAEPRFPRATPASSNPNLRQENFFGLTGSAWQNFAGNYTPGLGSPAVSTSDWYHIDGAYWLRPYDLLDGACGSAGATIAATPGKGRYAWFMSPDHSAGFPWADGQGIVIGFSNDPGVPPQTVTVIAGQQFAASTSALAKTADITASISGATLTATSVTGWFSFDSNAVVTGAGVTQALIVQQLTNTDTRPGGTGTYQISVSQTVGSQAMVISQQNFGVFATPFFVCNPDDATYPFSVYGEGAANRVQNETGVLKSADLVTWQPPIPTHVIYTYGPYSSYMRVVRTGVNNWYSTGFQANFPQAVGAFGYAKWTSTDGIIWAPASTLFSACLPANASGPVGNQPCTRASATFSQPSGAPPRLTVGAQVYSISNTNTYASSVRTGNQWVTRAPIDANFNVISSPAIVNISAAYAGLYPGPTYLNEVSAHVEDGIAHYYAAVGFPPSSSLGGTVSAAPYSNGGACVPGTGAPATCGGLWQQGKDYYTEIIDASAAAGAAPIGVKASCASSVASLAWFNALPQQTYRLYRGTSAGSQPTLIGDFTRTTATDTGMTLNAITYYKLVYLHSGVEQKNRVVSTWCSSDSQFVNAHYTRASAGGADMTTCNRTMINAFDAWLVSNSLSNNLLFGTMPEFCVAKSGSVITKIFDMGTTRLPRGGDYTPATSNTTYNATGISGKPAWVNGTVSAGGYYGGGRFNNIRRKTQITVFTAYQKPNTNQASLLVSGQFGARLWLTHTSGAPGGAEFRLYDATHSVTATATVPGLATDFHTIAGTFDGTTLLAYVDAVAGSGQTGLVIPSPNLNPPDALTGQIDNGPNPGSNWNTLSSGSDAGLFNPTTGYYAAGSTMAQYSGRAQMVFDKALSGAQITSLDALVR